MAHPLAGKPAPESLLVNVPRLVTAFYCRRPDPAVALERVSFGTSGHRGTSLDRSFNEDHILAITQAICDYRREHSITGPLFLGMDTHALSEPATATALGVLAANQVTTIIQEDGPTGGYTPTPAVSHAILTYNRGRTSHLADGIVVTPSHNPPADGGFKYNPPHGGPAGTAETKAIETRANALLSRAKQGVTRVSFEQALKAQTTFARDMASPYVDSLGDILDMQAIAQAGLRLGVDPMGGAAVGYWPLIAERWNLSLEVVNGSVDPTFSFMTVDKDGKIRMDCSSPYAMARLIELKDRFDVAFGNDPDVDRHGIVTKSGLMSPNDYLAVAVDYLFRTRTNWGRDVAVGKTLVTSSMIDRVAARLGRRVAEVPVGFKWFVEGLHAGRYGFGGEESAGASFLRRDGTAWTTDKDGLIMNLLAAEIAAVSGKNPAAYYRELAASLGSPLYERLDAPASRERKAALSRLSPDQVTAATLAGEPILAKLTQAPENNAPLGGLKVVTENGWFAARPSGTEDVYKIYCESFKGREHLERLKEEAKAIVDAAFRAAGV